MFLQAQPPSSGVEVTPPAPSDAPLRLEEFLPYRLNVLATQVAQSLARLYEARYGLGLPEWRILATLGQHGTLTAKEVGAQSHMHKTKVSRAVAALEQRGLVSRTINKDDLREAFLALTDSGLVVYRDLVPVARAFEGQLRACLSSDELAQLDIILAKLTVRSLGSGDGAAPGMAPVDDN